MLISSKYKNNIDKFIEYYKKRKISTVYISSRNNISGDLLQKIGLPEKPKNGENVVPIEIGRFTSFNLDGKYIIRKDLPKETRVVNTIYWKWKLWDGRECEDYCDVPRECYVRDFIAPPLEKVFFYEKYNSIVSRPINITENIILLHVVNMFLEIFGSCYITDNIDDIVPLEIVPWIIFPQGEKLVTAKNLFPNYKKLHTRERKFIDDRIAILGSFSPSKICQGISYFRNYVAFEFNNLTVLECSNLDNATYIFDKNWKDYSKLTKKEVLTNNFQKYRIIHNAEWIKKINQLLKR